MSEKEIGKALLQLDALQLAGVSDVRQQTWNILERDRRRVRRLTGLTVLLWLFAAGLLLTVLVAYGLLMPQHAKMIHDMDQGRLAKFEAELIQRQLQIKAYMISLGIAFAVAALGLAALTTVFLVLATRRATLRQVNASLLEIAEQLRRLRPPEQPARSS
jgi:uncharacterized membrane protein YbhN (UPF0104 family)